jgi:hypothetical protein
VDAAAEGEKKPALKAMPEETGEVEAAVAEEAGHPEAKVEAKMKDEEEVEEEEECVVFVAKTIAHNKITGGAAVVRMLG